MTAAPAERGLVVEDRPVRAKRGALVRRWLPALLLAAGVAALAVSGRFDGLYGQDAYAYYDYAIGPARASLLSGRPLPPFFWPPGYPLLTAALSLLFGTTPLAGQLLSLAAGAATVVGTGLLAETLWEPAGRRRLVPLAAALLAACHPQLWQSSAVVMADTTGLAAMTLGAWALARYTREGKGPWLVAAAAGMALAILTRWIYALAAVTTGLYVLGWLWTGGVQAEKSFRRRWGHALAAAATALVILLPLLWPAAVVNTAPTVESAPFAGSFEVYRWSPLNAFRREFVTTDGLLSYRLPNGLYYALAPAHRYFFTPVLAGLLAPGLWSSLRRGRGRLGWLAGWAALVFVFHAGAPWQNFRFTLAYLPPLAIVAAVGLDAVLGWAGRRGRRLVLAVFGLGLAAMLAGAVELTQGFINRKQADLETVAQVEARLPAGARLLTFNLTPTFQHYSGLETHELYYLPAAELPELLADGRLTFVLVDEQNILTQWEREPLADSFRWLRDTRGLERLAYYGSLTLARVR